ncbi:xanthine dehydrogenase family protein molybdopterin-binding subunit [Bradyrhizobium rifense]|uniref:Xanthine dehydrogenase family protein molybdopterin-binding subunit n=1 Tax=Bradyrhizobium rifense TaxID=515499 RepID=A0A5D3KNA3_9BRAD|nr:molybdopterin cofactor-binding domain-containing protein [Bradyrhizobium rifense]TYL97858.1 xanthine dehydrogenase family protein molybdopterin-binding subunit [Bradyrhizobium rifense]
MSVARLSRRHVTQSLGVVLATFALPSPLAFGQAPANVPFSLRNNRKLEGWIRLEADGTVMVFTGKAELGQGILTALAQIAAEELDVGFDKIRMVSADTSRGPDEQYTFGSQSVEQGGGAIRAAGAEARGILVAAAARRFGVRAEELKVSNGTVVAADGRRATFWELANEGAGLLKGDIALAAAPKKPGDYAIVGKSVNRIDLPGKLTGAPSYVQDIRLPGMVFARVVRPPRYGARLLACDEAAVRARPGVVAVISDGNFLAVAAGREEQAIAARDALAASAHWSDDAVELPDMASLRTELQKLRAETIVVGTAGQSEPVPAQARRMSAEYSRAYLSHAAIGPSCAVAWLKDGRMTVWSHTQGAFPLRGDLAKVLGMQNGEVDVVHVPGAGCYGHNGADDVALDAALVARAVPGAPVKLQWMRDDEFAWAPFGPGMAMKVEAALGSDGRIVDWSYDVWSNSHAMRPGQAGGVNLLAAWDLKTPFVKSPAPHIPQPFGDGDRNAVPSYELPRKEIRNHLLLDAPVRNGSFRTLGSHGNIFAIESFMDELAEAAGSDPLAFRLAHLRDPRAQAVLRVAADKAGWAPGRKGDGQRGRGLAFCRYKSIGMYAAVVVDVEVDRKTGVIKVLRVVMAADIGLVVNPDGAKNQLEGGIVQAVSLALKEQVTFDRRQITSRDWSGYSVLTFSEVPNIDIVLVQRSDPPLGAGEGSLPPTSAALANAFAHATGRRLRELPMTPERVKATLS